MVGPHRRIVGRAVVGEHVRVRLPDAVFGAGLVGKPPAELRVNDARIDAVGELRLLPDAAAAIAIELIGGILLVIGWQTRWAATAIFLFLIPTTLIFHPFWAVAAGKQMEMIQFMKNLCIMGGMLYVMAFGAGPLSVDNRKRA